MLGIIPLLMAGAVPEANVLLTVALGTVLTVANAMTYAYLSAAMPRSGGEYVYLGRVVHPAAGFTANWGFQWSQLLGLGLYASFTVNFGIAVAFLTLGNVLDSAGLVTAGENVSGDWWTFGLGTAMIVSVLVVLSMGPRVVRRVLNVLFVPAIIGSFVTLFVLLTTTRSEFVSRFNTFMADRADGQTYDSILAAADKAGFVEKASTVGALLLAVPIGYYIYIGFTYSTYIGGEVKEPARTQPRMIAATLAFAAVMYLLCLWRFYEIVGQDFINSVVFLNDNSRRRLRPAGRPGAELLHGDHDLEHDPQRADGDQLLPLELPAAVRHRDGLHAQPVRVVGGPRRAGRASPRSTAASTRRGWRRS